MRKFLFNTTPGLIICVVSVIMILLFIDYMNGKNNKNECEEIGGKYVIVDKQWNVSTKTYIDIYGCVK